MAVPPHDDRANLVVLLPSNPTTLILNRTSIQAEEFTTQELGILVYMISVYTDPSLPPDKRIINIDDILCRFPQDNPISLVLCLKSLAKKGYVDPESPLDLNIVDFLQEQYGEPVQ